VGPTAACNSLSPPSPTPPSALSLAGPVQDRVCPVLLCIYRIEQFFCYLALLLKYAVQLLVTSNVPAYNTRVQSAIIKQQNLK
jgi:hypothetical protein